MNLMRYRDFGVISSKIILALLRRTTLRPKRLYLPGMQQFIFDPREVVSTFNEIFVCEIYRPIKPLPNNCRVLDIGAHYGLFTIYAMLRFRVGKIECFEPNPNTFQFLRANIAAAHDNSRVSLNPVAVCGQSGTTKLFIPADGATSVASRLLHRNQELMGRCSMFVQFLSRMRLEKRPAIFSSLMLKVLNTMYSNAI